MKTNLFLTSIALTFACFSAAELRAETLQPYQTYLAEGVNLGVTRTAFDAAYPGVAKLPESTALPAADNYQILGTVIADTRPLRMVSFHFVRDQLVALDFSGRISPTYPERAAKLEEFRAMFLQGFTKQGTETYSTPTPAGPNRIRVSHVKDRPSYIQVHPFREVSIGWA